MARLADTTARLAPSKQVKVTKLATTRHVLAATSQGSLPHHRARVRCVSVLLLPALQVLLPWQDACHPAITIWTLSTCLAVKLQMRAQQPLQQQLQALLVLTQPLAQVWALCQDSTAHSAS